MAQKKTFIYNKPNAPDIFCANEKSGAFFGSHHFAIKPIIVTQKEVNQP